MVARGGIEPPTRGFSVRSRGLIINHLQRFPALSPAIPRHIHGTPNLSSTHSWHRASRSAANSQLALERYEISGKTERPLVDPEAVGGKQQLLEVLAEAKQQRPP